MHKNYSRQWGREVSFSWIYRMYATEKFSNKLQCRFIAKKEKET